MLFTVLFQFCVDPARCMVVVNSEAIGVGTSTKKCARYYFTRIKLMNS